MLYNSDSLNSGALQEQSTDDILRYFLNKAGDKENLFFDISAAFTKATFFITEKDGESPQVKKYTQYLQGLETLFQYLIDTRLNETDPNRPFTALMPEQLN